MAARAKTTRTKSTPARARRASHAARPDSSAGHLHFVDTSWETIKQVLAREMDGLTYLIDIDPTTVVEDSGQVIVVGVRTAELASRIARNDAVHIP